MFLVTYKPSTSHWIVPPIIIGVLLLLMVVMLIQNFMKAKKEGRPFLELKGKRFFLENYDKIKLWGTLILFIAYIFLMETIGFLGASILVVLVYNIIFDGVERLGGAVAAIKEKTFFKNDDFKSVVISVIVSVTFAVLIWYLFGNVFNITLP